MTVAADRWPALVRAPSASPPGRRGVLVVWGMEVRKLAGQLRVRAVVGVCVVAPLLVAAVFSVQAATPNDTLFGQWIPESGWALPLVILRWAGQWLLPALVAVVAGDIFSAEDHLGTWKMVLTRSRSRREIFAGKMLAAATYAVVVLALLAAAGMLAGVLLHSRPLVGLSGQTVPAGRAAELVAYSWATQLPPLLAFGALAALLSIWSRNSVVGIGAPVLIGLFLQLLSLVDLPLVIRQWLITTPFESWLGLWTQPSFTGPTGQGLLTSAVWVVGAGAGAWIVFRRRDVRAA